MKLWFKLLFEPRTFYIILLQGGEKGNRNFVKTEARARLMPLSFHRTKFEAGIRTPGTFGRQSAAAAGVAASKVRGVGDAAPYGKNLPVLSF